ncbi:MAG: hypothetical protein LBF83_06830 [Spirochaetaceae bacterium]|jgi:hypothetical protein|nr:hypothetical protein [Spirochaetaceae bacterium]
MNDDTQLSLFYQQYVDGNLSKHELETSIFRHVLECPNGHYGLAFKNQSDRIDFLCWFYPAMQRVIDHYDSRIASFSVYMAATLRYSYRHYRRYDRKRTATELACWSASSDESFYDSFVCEPEIDDESGDGMYVNCDLNLQKHIMLVLLKSFYYVSDSLVDKAAAAIGMDPDVLGEMVNTLRRLQIKKITKLQRLSDSAHCLYYRCLTYEKWLSQKDENTYFNRLFSRYLDRGRKRLAKMRKCLKSIRIEASNSELAEVTGIPKGTIDSRLALIKCKRTLNKLIPQPQRDGSGSYEDVNMDFLW